MRKQFLVLFLAAFALLTGCKKDNDKPGPDTPGSTKRLKRIIETEDGVTTTYTFSYDASKRLTAVMSNNEQEMILFTYDNNGNVVKVENKEDDNLNVFTFTYANNIPVSGSFRGYENNGAENILTDRYDLSYTVSNGVVNKITDLMQNPLNQQETFEIAYDLTYHNGNLSKIASSGLMAYSAMFTYGNKKPIYPPVFNYVMDPAGFSTEFFARNEILSVNYDFAGTELDNVITNEYTYDAQGYVLTANDGQTQSRFEYE